MKYAAAKTIIFIPTAIQNAGDVRLGSPPKTVIHIIVGSIAIKLLKRYLKYGIFIKPKIIPNASVDKPIA